MNEQIKLKKPERPVIVVQDYTGRQWEVNNVKLELDPVYVAPVSVQIDWYKKEATVRGSTAEIKHNHKGCPDIESHEVKAWVEIT